jgi:hypothetical protein
MKRVTRAGGTVAAVVWDYAGEMTLLRSFWDSAVAVDPAAAEFDEGRCMPYCQPDELKMLWVDQGLAGVEVGPLVVEADYSSFEDLWEPLEAGVAPSGAYVAALPDEQRRKLRDELHRRLDLANGPFSLRARAWCVVGKRC